MTISYPVRLLKVVFVLELLLAGVWTFPIISVEHPGVDVVMLFFWTAPISLAFMATSVVFFVRRPETRVMASVVFFAPLAILFLPSVLRSIAGGAIDVPPSMPGLALLGLPVAIVLLLPHEVAGFLPTWALRSRAVNVGLLILLAIILFLWVALLAAVAGPEPIRTDDASGFVVIAFLVLVASNIVPVLTLVYSWVGLFQKRDRRQQWLRVVQLVFSTLLLAGSLPVVYFGLVITMFNPG